jgi:hypothetical protein
VVQVIRPLVGIVCRRRCSARSRAGRRERAARVGRFCRFGRFGRFGRFSRRHRAAYGIYWRGDTHTQKWGRFLVPAAALGVG